MCVCVTRSRGSGLTWGISQSLALYLWAPGDSGRYCMFRHKKKKKKNPYISKYISKYLSKNLFSL